MKVRFWGTRGSIAKPGPDTVGFGGNTSCVEVRSESGALAMVDCGTGAHGFGHALLAQAGGEPLDGHILVTHTHWDHIQGFPFFAPLFQKGGRWQVYGPRGSGASLKETMSGQMQYAHFPVNLEQLIADVTFHELVEGEFMVGDMRVTAHYLNHPALTLGYRIEGDGACVVYASDHEPHDRRLATGGAPGQSEEDQAHVAFLADADLVIHDCQYRAEEYPAKVGWGHSTIEYAVDCAVASGARALALYHHDPMRTDEGVAENIERASARAAAAGSTLRVFGAVEGETHVLTGRPPTNARARESVQDAREAVPMGAGAVHVLTAGVQEDAAAQIAQALADEGHSRHGATTLARAIELVERTQPPVIFVGLDLDGGSAFDLCAAVRALPGRYASETLVIAVAHTVADAAHMRGHRVGITDWLTGPLTPQYVRSRLRAWLLRQACRWQPAPIPENEEQRLDALADLNLLDTPAEARFDRITQLAASVFEVPIALVSLVDAERQWFKSRHGVDVSETPRDRAFCAHAILDDKILLVPDTLNDDRFAGNPLVIGAPHIRFYAGAPIATPDGARIGTLCILDQQPRVFSERQCEMLAGFARLVEAELRSTSDC